MSYAMRYESRELKKQKQADTIDNVLANFMLDKPKKTVFGNYRIVGNELKFVSTQVIEQEFNSRDGKIVIDQFNLWAMTINSDKFCPRYQSNYVSKDTIIKELGTSKSARIKAIVNVSNTIAKKITRDGKIIFLGNSSILPLIGRVVAYGNETLNRSETSIQRLMTVNSQFIMIPFIIFEQAKLNIDTFTMIEKRASETLKINRVEESGYGSNKKTKVTIENRHFTGASLFNVDGKCYLFDVDRREVEHYIFNPFLAQVTGNPTTIEQAYYSLKPKAVLQAEKQGLEVLRQGEWFFVKTKQPKLKKLTKLEKFTILGTGRFGMNEEMAKLLGIDSKSTLKLSAKLLKGIPRQQELRVGNSRPNVVELLLEQGKNIYCSGKVSHSGREHADLILKGWYKCYSNTSKQNVTVTGNVD